MCLAKIRYAYHTRIFSYQTVGPARSRAPFLLMKYRQFTAITPHVFISHRNQYESLMQQWYHGRQLRGGITGDGSPVFYLEAYPLSNPVNI